MGCKCLYPRIHTWERSDFLRSGTNGGDEGWTRSSGWKHCKRRRRTQEAGLALVTSAQELHDSARVWSPVDQQGLASVRACLTSFGGHSTSRPACELLPSATFSSQLSKSKLGEVQWRPWLAFGSLRLPYWSPNCIVGHCGE